MSCHSRRDFLRAAIALSAAMPLAARPALARGGGDRDLIERAIALEQKLTAAYGRAPGFDQAGSFRAHCLKHARGLTELLRNRGGRAPAPQATIGRPQRAAALLEAESEAVAELHRALARLEDADLLAVFASIMANHAQHQLVLRQRLGQAPASLAFETGAVG